MRKNKKYTRLLFRSILSMLCVLIFAAAGAVCFAEEADTYNAPTATVSSEIGTFEVLAEGEALFSDRTHVFSSTVPSWLVGKTYLRTPLSASVSVTAKSAGRVYVITQTKGNDSQISSLTEQGFTKLTTYSNTDFSATLKYGVAVMAKDVNAGDRFSYTKWGILVADFAPDDLATVAVDEQTGTEAVAAEGVRIFTGSTKHAFAATMPQGLIGQSFLKASISNGVNATVKNAGHLYVLTATEGSSSQLSALSAQGFVQIASISPKTVSTTLQEPLALMWKHATKGESITFSKWAILFTKVTNDVSEEETVLNETATVTVGAGVAATARVGEKIFIDRAYTCAETLPSELAGKS
jgi:hypothetical protein